MKYDRDGFPKLKKISHKTCFADVFITIRQLGFDVSKGPKQDCIQLSKTVESTDGIPYHARWENNYVTMEDLPDFLNREMVEQGYIEEEVEI